MSNGYAGDLTPQETWELLKSNPDAVLVDVRTDAEWRWVGLPDPSGLGKKLIKVEWNSATGRNPNFLGDLAAAGLEPGRDAPVLFLCRSGVRSVAAAIAATAAGIGPAYNITEGFEGVLNDDGHRGGDGWRAAGLPWKQS